MLTRNRKTTKEKEETEKEKECWGEESDRH